MGSEEDGDRAVGIVVDADGRSDEMRPEPARRQLEGEAAPFDGVVVAEGALPLDAEDLAAQCRPVGHEGGAFLLWLDREGRVVLRDGGVGEPAICRLDGGDAGGRQLLWQ